MENTFKRRIDAAKQKLQEAQYIVIGGGAGLSAAAGLSYSGTRFTENFAPFIQKYGLTDMYSSGFYPFPSEEERWAYWAKHIYINRFEPSGTNLYQSLFQLVQHKNYFVITTNVDSQFEKSGFPQDRIFEVQGNYGWLQCAKGCHDTIYNNETVIHEMIEQTSNCAIPSELVPRCPICGGKMDPHLRINQYFVQNEKWYAHNQAYNAFITQSKQANIVYLELGIGFNTPGIIRYPFERMTYENEHATLIRLNREHPEGVEENREQTISFTEDMTEVLFELLQ